MPDPRISTAVSLYNEGDVLPELLRRLADVIDRLPGGPHEMVFVDDGSTDETFALLAAAAERDPRIIAISLSRNFGHQSALSAALDHVTGDVVVILDGDLQDPPEEIPRLLEACRNGFDVAYARRVARKEGWILKACYFFFYRMIAILSNLRLPVDAGDFSALSRRVVDRLRQLPEHHRYLRGLRTWVGFRQVGIPIERSRRLMGHSKYNMLRLLRLAFDGIFAFSMAPLRAAALAGLLAVIGSLLFSAYAIFERLFLGHPPRGFPALIVAVSFLSGVELLFLGVIGEYVGRIYEEVKDRPHYVIGRIVRKIGSDHLGTEEGALRGLFSP
jgi:dolichol-phosphate mannosyltransferase